MRKNGFKASERPVVQYVPDLELAYVSQRYKEIHDLLHVILLDEINVHN
jgi:ubiquinone biosynthesis protein COQ4